MKDPFGSFVSGSDDKCFTRISEKLRGWSIAHAGLKPRHRGFPHPPPWSGSSSALRAGRAGGGLPRRKHNRQTRQTHLCLSDREGSGAEQARPGMA